MTDIFPRLARALADSATQKGLPRGAQPAHAVNFYRDDNALSDAVVEFLAESVQANQPIVVIATEAHRQVFAQRLRAMGLDTDELLSGRLALWLDARDTLAAFMEGPVPNRELFMATVGNVFERILDKRYYLIVRAYGEMVDLLWKDGNRDGAILVEQLWNELAARYQFSLLCGYSIDHFLLEAGADGVRRICDQHTHAVPFISAVEPVTVQVTEQVA